MCAEFFSTFVSQFFLVPRLWDDHSTCPTIHPIYRFTTPQLRWCYNTNVQWFSAFTGQKHFGAGAKSFWMLEPGIWVPRLQPCTQLRIIFIICNIREVLFQRRVFTFYFQEKKTTAIRPTTISVIHRNLATCKCFVRHFAWMSCLWSVHQPTWAATWSLLSSKLFFFGHGPNFKWPKKIKSIRW